MALYQKLIVVIDDITDRLIIPIHRNAIKKKFNDSRRKVLCNSVSLTKEQKTEIDSFYKCNYGRKIPYTWHKHCMSFTGKFDAKYFPELLYIPEFEYFMNLWPEYVNAFSDKNVLPYIASSAGVLMPKTVVSCSKGLFLDSEYNEVKPDYLEKLEGRYFLKPTVDSQGGVGCRIIDLKDGVDLISKEGISQIISYYGVDFVIQDVVKCHPSISLFHPCSVNTFRIITYRWQGEILHTPIALRLGRGGGCLDNIHSGGLYVAVDDDGTVHKMAFSDFGNRFEEHPDTHIKFEGCKIDLMSNVLVAAESMHRMMPQIGVVNWDFTIAESGKPLLMEANLKYGSIRIPETSHGVGPFGDKTEDILKWMRLMKKTPKHLRKNYAFGKMK